MINPMDMTGKTIIVTGASSGMGRETAVHISRLGGRVVLVARNRERLGNTFSKLDGEGHTIYPFDFQNVSEIETLVKNIY